MRRQHLALAGLLIATLAAAQPVYESRDRSGPVFSDMPTTGAREMHLPPANVMDPPVATPLPAPPPATAPAYASLQIMQPEDDGTVHSNTGQFSIALTLEPPLQLERGDAIAVRLDGTVLADKRTTLQFDVTADEWQMAARDQVEHTVEVAVVDRSGNALLVAAPVRFYVHRASRRN
jgi:hypothetical protein